MWLIRAILDTSHKKTFCDPTWLVPEQVRLSLLALNRLAAMSDMSPLFGVERT